MKYCSHCGNELLDQAVICPKCGCQVNNYNFYTNNQQQNYQANAQPQQKKMNILALIGFIFSFITPIIGLILSIVGRNQIIQNPEQDGESLAKAGIIISAVRLVLNVLATIAGVIYSLIFFGIILS